MEKFLTFSYWLEQNPGPLEATAQKIFIFILLIFFIGIFSFSFLKKKKGGLYFKIWRNLASLCITNLIIGMFLLFFTEQSIPVLSSRYWFLIWAIGIGFWAYFIIGRIVKIPEIKAEREKKKQFSKYLP